MRLPRWLSLGLVAAFLATGLTLVAQPPEAEAHGGWHNRQSNFHAWKARKYQRRANFHRRQAWRNAQWNHGAAWRGGHWNRGAAWRNAGYYRGGWHRPGGQLIYNGCGPRGVSVRW